ncbi:MAG: tetratricopeptide repeat protein [Alphaproteobacteria bacterium]
MIPAISDAGHHSVHAGPRPGVSRWMRVLSGAFVAVIFAMLLTLSAPPASAQSERLSEQERRIGGLVKTGRAMLSNQQYARAYKHFLTYTRQEPEEARLYRWLVLSSIYAERKDALTELMTEAAAQAEATTKLPFLPDLADYALAELAMADGDIAAVQTLLQDFSERRAPSPVLVLLGQVALLNNNFDDAQRLAQAAVRKDPGDPEAERLAAISRGLNTMTTQLEEIILDPAAYDFMRLTEPEVFGTALLLPYQPQALQERVSTQLIEAYLSIGNRNPELRQLVDVFRLLADLSVGGVESLLEIEANVNELAVLSPDFAESESFLKVLELIGRFWLAVREYERAFDTFDQIALLQEQRGDVAEFACSLVILGRTATLMGRRDEAREFRDRARSVTEQLSQKSRTDLLRPWGQAWPFVGVVLLALLTLVSLAGTRVLAPGLIAPLRPAAPKTAQALSNQTTRRVWIRSLRLIGFALLFGSLFAALALGALVLDWAAVARFQWRDETFAYNQLYAWTDVPRMLAVAFGGACLLAAVVLLMLATLKRQTAPEVAQQADARMATGGSLEAYVTALGAEGVQAGASAGAGAVAARNPALVRRAEAVTEGGLPGWVFPFALSPILFAAGLILLSSVLTGYRFLPTPEQPTPPLCDPDTYVPPPFLQASQPPPPQQQQRQAPMGGDSEGETGLDVSDSEVPDSALNELPFERSVGGLDDAGEPLDYYTRLPDRQFDIDRSTGVDSNTNRSGAYRLEDTGLSPRQAVPDRYRGRWD